MSRGLSYQTARQMPPGMAEKAAVKLVQNMQAAGVAIIPAPAATTPKKTEKRKTVTVQKKAIYAENLLQALRDDPGIKGRVFAQIKQHINAMPAAALWIPAAERKPDAELQIWRQEHETEPLQVLVVIKGAKEPTVLSYDEDGDFFAVDDYGDVDYCNVTYWQSLPPVPGVER